MKYNKKFLFSVSQKILIASDHAGFDLKQTLIKKLLELNLEPVDLGCNSADISVDYPDYAQKLSSEINNQNNLKGILICGSGIGISIAANRFKHVRAALCTSTEMAKLSRAHNNANVVCLGARLTKEDSAIDIIKTFLSTQFEGARHEARIAKLSK